MTTSENSAADFLGDWILALLLAANLVWTTLCLGGYRPETMVVSWALTGSAAAVYFLLLAVSNDRIHPASWWSLPFLAYSAINVAWVSPVPWLGWRDWLGWLQMAATFWISLNGVRRSDARAFLFGTVVSLGVGAVALAAYQRFLWPDWLMLGRTQADQFIGRSSGPFGIPNSLAAFLLLPIPPLLALTWQRGASAVQRVLCGYLLVVFLFGLSLTISRGAWLSLIVALACWPLFLRNQDWIARITLSTTALAAGIMSAVILYSTVPLVKARLDGLAADRGERSRPILWRAATQLFAEAPVFGTGGGSFNTLFERYRPEGFRDNPVWAHNDYLNTLSDYGAVGFGLSFGAIAALAIVARRRARARSGTPSSLLHSGWRKDDITSAGTVGMLAFALSLFVDFHLKIPALATTIALFGAEWMQRTWPPISTPATGSMRQLGALLATGGVFVFVLAIAVPTFRAEAARYAARQAIDHLAETLAPPSNLEKEVLEAASPELTDAVAIDSSNAQAWADRAYASSLWGRLDVTKMNELGHQAESDAREALRRSESVFEFWIRLGVSLDMQGRHSEAGQSFARALALAPANPIAWYYQAYHLSLTPAGRHLATAANENCLRLDPSNRSALALRQRLSSSP